MKFLGEVQSAYPKKNWSSLMLLNCGRCTALTPEYVNTATGLDLHRFHWLAGDHEIGALPERWNHLVAVQDPPHEAGEGALAAALDPGRPLVPGAAHHGWGAGGRVVRRPRRRLSPLGLMRSCPVVVAVPARLESAACPAR